VYPGADDAVGIDAGTGFTEVTGGAYARAGRRQRRDQRAHGRLAVLTFAAVPSWIVAGMTGL
jgi:hypothetical protein